MSERVLHVLAQRPGQTGSGVTLDALVREAGLRGWDQLVVVGVPTGESVPAIGGLAADRVHPLEFGTDRLPFPVPGMSDVMPYRSSRYGELTAVQLDAYRAAWRQHLHGVLHETRPDIVHVHHLWIVAGIVAELVAETGTPTRTVAHSHGTGLRQLELCPHLAAEIKSAARQHAAFLALHDEQAAAIARALDVERDRVHVVGAGYREELFHTTIEPARRPERLLYAGKLSVAKGVETLARAFATLREREPSLELHIAGAGAGAEGERLATLLAETAGVVLHGALPPERLADLMRSSAVFVLPSFYEGLPLVLVEAAASGCRLVATNLPGVRNALRPTLDSVLTTVELPVMESVDRPVAASLPDFENRLAGALEAAWNASPSSAVDVRPFAWSAVFERIERVWSRSSTQDSRR